MGRGRVQLKRIENKINRQQQRKKKNNSSMAQTLAMPVAPSLALISNPRPLSRAVYFPVLNPPKVRGLSIECARVGGVKITNNKRIEFSLQYIHGISVLCDAEVALIVFSTTGKLFEYSSDPWLEVFK
ncbi:hypothetical protein HN51_049958 [Arachis hypogaea]